MKRVFKYGTLNFSGAKPGDAVRFVDAPSAGQVGAILLPRGPHEINASLIRVENGKGYVELKPRTSTSASGEAGIAAGIRVGLSISAGGSLKIS